MDVQPTLSPFNPAHSYSLIVDDFFNLEDQEISVNFTDEEGFDEECDNNDQNNNSFKVFKSYIYEDDHMIAKEKEELNEEEMELSVENKNIEEIIIFDPHISDGKELAKLELMNTFHDAKENINYSVSMKYQEDNKPILLSSLCSNQLTKPLNCAQDQHSPNPTSGPMLPPCRVCGEKASGFHYGANTCEACKGFFRRSLQRKQSYRCLGNNDCDISSGKRNICAACRYQKCVALGMSKTAIKTGRYTHAKKTKDIQEVKRLQRKQMISDHQLHPSNPFLIFSDPLDEELAEKIVGGIMEIHRQQTPHTPEFFEKLSQKEQDYLTRRKLKEEMFGPLRPISRDEYTNIYHCTGIDVDGRKAMLEHMLPCIERAVKRFVTFAKAVPGFKELPLEDQIKLIKGSRFEAWLISSYRAFNSEHLLYTHYCGNTVHLENMSRLYDENFLRDVFKMVGDIKRLDLTEEEECILKAILIFFRDRSVLQDPDMVDVHQMRLVQALNFIHLKRKPKDKIFFGKISAVLTEMRTLTDIHKTQENKIQVEWATDVPIPPLLYELFYV